MIDILRKSRVKDTIKGYSEIFCGALATCIGALAVALRNIISLAFMGHNGDKNEMAAASFGITWVNAFGYSILFGFAIGLSTQVAQAFGAKKFKAIGLLLQKTLVILGIFCLILFFFFLNTSSILTGVGMDPEFSRLVGYYCISSTIGCAGYGVSQVLRYYLSAVRDFHATALINCLGLLFHVFYCYLLVDLIPGGVIGLAFARTLTETTSAAMYYFYLKYRNPCPEADFVWGKEAYNGLLYHTKELVYHGSSIYLEWMALQISSIMVGFTKDDDVIAAHGSVITYLVYVQSFTLGVSVSTSTYVGNYAGEGSETKAKEYSVIGASIEVVVCLGILIATLLYRTEIGEFYTGTTETVEQIRFILIFYGLGIIGDYGSNFIAFVLRALNQQRIVTFCFIFSYYVVGAPLSYILGFSYEYGIGGVWTGILIGYWVMFYLMIRQLKTINWAREVAMVQRNVKKQNQGNDDIEIEVLSQSEDHLVNI